MRSLRRPTVALGRAVAISALGISLVACAPRRQVDVGWAPTPTAIAAQGLEWLGVHKGDVVAELGCGDGRVAVVAAQLGADVLCVELAPLLAAKARAAVAQAGVADHVRVIEGDIFQTDFSRANVVFFFLLPSVNDRLLPLFRRQLKPGTRLLSREFQFREWPAEQTLSLPGFTFYAWTLPPRAVAADHP